MQGTFLLMAVSVRSVGLWSSVGLCTLGIKILQVALRCPSHWSHIAFTLICFIFICFFSSFFCSRRKAASCRQGHRDWNEHGWALQRASWSFWKNQTTKKPSSTWVHISDRMSWLLTGGLHMFQKLAAHTLTVWFLMGWKADRSWLLLKYLHAALEIP